MTDPPPVGRAAETTLGAGIRFGVTMLTVLPLRAGRVDRPVAAIAMTAAPLVGGLLGAVVGLALTVGALAVPVPVAAGVAVAIAVLLTRGLHLDGLADTADALGSYRARDAALQVMKRPDIGPFGVAAIVLVLLIQAAALGGIAAPAEVASPGSIATALVATVVAVAAGRLAVPVACLRGVPAARADGLGALVAGTVRLPALVIVAAAVAGLGVWAVPGRPWQGPLAVPAAAAVAVLVVRHAVRRFGGITGDVIGAAVELSTATALLVLVVGRVGASG